MAVTKEEINKIIAEFMGSDRNYVFNIKKCYRHGDDTSHGTLYYPFHESLDALIPVVEKLKINDWAISKWVSSSKVVYLSWVNDDVNTQMGGESPSLALATACAQVIKEL